MKKLLLASLLLFGTGCSMFDIPPEFEARLTQIQDQVRNDTLERDEIRSKLLNLEPDDARFAELSNELSALEGRIDAAPQAIANVRADLNEHYIALSDKVAGMAEAGLSAVGVPIAAAFPAAAPIVGLLAGIFGNLRRKKNGS